MITLVDAINRAKSTDPKAIQAALLQATDIPGDQLDHAVEGCEVRRQGQNTQFAQGINMQVFGGSSTTRCGRSTSAAKELVWPRPKWADMK